MTNTTHPTDLAGQGHVLLDAVTALRKTIDPRFGIFPERPWEAYAGDEASLGGKDGYLAMLDAAEATVVALAERGSPVTAMTSVDSILDLQACEVCASVAALADNFCAACGCAQGRQEEVETVTFTRVQDKGCIIQQCEDQHD